MAWSTAALGRAGSGASGKLHAAKWDDTKARADLSAASGSFHELTARLLLEHERILALNGELQAELARTSWEASVKVAEKDSGGSAPCESTSGLPLEQPEMPWFRVVARWEPPEASCPVEASTQTPAARTPTTRGTPSGEQPQETLASGSTLKDLQAEECECDSPKFSGYGSSTGKHSRDLLERIRPMRESVSSLGSSMSVTVRRLSSNGRPLPRPLAKVYLFLEDHNSSVAAFWYKVCGQTLLFVSVVTPLLQMLNPPVVTRDVGMVLETVFDVLFTLELLARFIVSPAPRIFFCNGFNIIDLLPIATLVFRLIVGSEAALGEDIEFPTVVLLCGTPLMRLLKMLRRWETMHLLTKALADVLEALPVLLFPLFILTLTFATLIYIVEREESTPTLPTALWLTIVTMTTVGYGDVVPKTTLGHLIVSALVISSVMYMAMPVAILGSSFTRVWQERATVMLMHRTRERLARWGYTAHDVPMLFQMFCKDGSGGLNIPEFIRMIKTLKLGLTNERILQLFRTFDTDSSGVIDDKEFVRNVYPNRYMDLYGMREESEQFEPLPPPTSVDATVGEGTLSQTIDVMP